MTRRQIREAVIRLVYMSDFRDREDIETSVQLMLDDTDIFEDEEEPPSMKESDRKEIEEKAFLVIEKKSELDALIDEKAEGWKTSRIPKVDLSIIRVAIYEAKYAGLDKGIVINEAVDIAKKYGDANSGSFVNGILARIV